MTAGLIIDIAVGLICIILGLVIWKKQKITILHDYHYRNVKSEDVKAYTKAMGTGVIIIGVGICITGIFNIFEFNFWWVPLLIGCVAGFIILHRAQMKYNGSWFS